MLTSFDVESVAGSRSCVSGVSGKAFREGFTKDNRLPARKLKRHTIALGYRRRKPHKILTKTRCSDAAAPGHTEGSRGDIRRFRPSRS